MTEEQFGLLFRVRRGEKDIQRWEVGTDRVAFILDDERRRAIDTITDQGDPAVSGSKRSVARVFPPGDFIREELEARGWTQRDLAEILGRPVQAVNAIVNGKKEITPETAIALGAAFQTSPEFWLNLESAYRLASVRRKTHLCLVFLAFTSEIALEVLALRRRI